MKHVGFKVYHGLDVYVWVMRVGGDDGGGSVGGGYEVGGGGITGNYHQRG